MEIIDKLIKSEYQPKQTNVAWIDTSGEQPVTKHFINGKWQVAESNELTPEQIAYIINQVDISGKADKEVTPTVITPSVDGTIQNMTSNEISMLKLGDIIKHKVGIDQHGNGLYSCYSVDHVSEEIITCSYSATTYIYTVYFRKVNGTWQYITMYSISPMTLASKVTIATTQPQYGMYPNTLYNLGELSANMTFVLAAATDNTIANVWTWTFSTGSNAPTITWPTQITMWSDGEAPTIEANKYYEVSVMNGVGTVISADIPEEEEETEVEP